MNPKKLKIILYLPLALFFMANLFYYPLPAKAADCMWKDGVSVTSCDKIVNTGDYTITGIAANCAQFPGSIPASMNTPLCCCESSAPSRLNTDMPKLEIPDINLQVAIPGLNLTKGKAIKCTEVNGQKNCDIPWIGEYIAGIYKYAIGIVGILAAVVLMIGGVMWIVAGGSATMVGEAKAWIGASLTGLVIALCSYTILYQVNPALLSFKSLNIGIIQDIKPEQIKYTGGGGEMGTSVIPADPTARDSYDTLLSNADYDCTLLKAVMFAESSGRPNITSSAGAVGLMQVMPSTAQSLGVNGNLYDPQTNINVGAKYLTQLSSTACNGSSNNSICRASDIKYVIAAYNGGPLANKESTVCPGKTFWECENNQGYAQTRKYVSTVTANFESLKNNGGDCQ